MPKLVYGCRGEIELIIKNQDTALLVYTLEKRDSDLSYTAESSKGHTFSGLSGNDYTLRIQSPGGCDTTLHIQLEEYPSLEVTVDPTDATIRYGDTLQLFAEGAQSYVWFPPNAVDRHDIPNPITYPLQPTQLFVVGTNAYGCRDTGYVNIDIDYTMPDLIPNAFSPNGDGLNDVFKIEGITYQRILPLRCLTVSDSWCSVSLIRTGVGAGRIMGSPVRWGRIIIWCGWRIRMGGSGCLKVMLCCCGNDM